MNGRSAGLAGEQDLAYVVGTAHVFFQPQRAVFQKCGSVYDTTQQGRGRFFDISFVYEWSWQRRALW